MTKKLLFVAFASLAFAFAAQADERHFTYSYEADVLPEGAFELEQWVTNQSGKEDGDYTEWNLRTEFEFGVTEQYMTALYLNLDSVRSEGVDGEEDETETEFEGVSWENIYQFLNPHIDPVGLAGYVELSTDGLDFEVETKLLLSKEIEDFILATNVVYEAEWEREHSQTEKEAGFEITLGAAYKLKPNWSVGLEARNKYAFPDGTDLSGQEFQAWNLGPNVHYGNKKWWATLTVLPQLWGNGDGANGSRQLVHEEEVEVRLIAGVVF